MLRARPSDRPGILSGDEDRYAAGTPSRNRKAGLWPWFMGVGAGGLLTLGVATVAIVLLGQPPPNVAQVRLADHLPDWVPLYPGASLEESKLDQDGVSGHYRFLAAANTSGVLDWYDQQLEDRGFTSVRYDVLAGQALRCTSQSQKLEVVITLRADGVREQGDVVFGRL